jgi:hypothetical protein
MSKQSCKAYMGTICQLFLTLLDVFDLPQPVEVKIKVHIQRFYHMPDARLLLV